MRILATDVSEKELEDLRNGKLTQSLAMKKLMDRRTSQITPFGETVLDVAVLLYEEDASQA